MRNKNYYALDIAKFISAFLIVSVHTQPLLNISTTGHMMINQIIARLAVPLFFIISGYLFFVKLDDEREWNDYAHVKALKRFVMRILKLYLVWTVIYLPFNYMLVRDGGISLVDVLRYIRDFFFTGSYYHLWFLPSLIVAVVGVYLLRLHFSPYQTVGITAVLYLIGMLQNVYEPLLSNVDIINNVFQVYEAIFVTTRNGIFYGMLFVAIAALLAKSHLIVNRSKTMPLICFILSFIGMVAECLFLDKIGCLEDMTCMYIMAIPCVVSLFLWLLSLDLRKREIYLWMRKTSLLIYVSHLVFIDLIQGVFANIPLMLLFILTCIFVLLFATIVLALSKRIPILKHLYA